LESGSWAYNQLRHVELACCCWFAAEWLLRLWTSNDRLRYLVSLQSLVDLLTVVPLFLTYIWDAVGTCLAQVHHKADQGGVCLC
jgi:hypothetical protein